MDEVYIYGLFDPRNGHLRYIGKTVNIKNRFNEHLRTSRNEFGHNKHKEAWINSLMKLGTIPTIQILEICDKSNWDEKECEWINRAKELGIKLTNQTSGGIGFHSGKEHPCYGKKLSDDHKEKMSVSLKGKRHIVSEAQREKLRLANLGKRHSEETKEKMSLAQSGNRNHFYGKKHSEETTIKMRKPHGPFSKEHIEKLVKARNKRVSFSDDTKKKMRLSLTMSWAKRKNDIKRILDLQEIYFSLFGEYNYKFPVR